MRFCRSFAALALAATMTCVAFAHTTPDTAEVAPGITLPASGTVAVLDTATATPHLYTLHATEIKTNMHAGGNFARSMVYANQHHGVEIAGAHAAQTVVSTTPVVYVRLPSDEPELQRSRLTLLMLRAEKDSREVMQFSNNVFGGGHKRNLEEIAVTKQDVEDGKWLKITPDKPLEPGEYAIATIPKDKLMMPDLVYDFSVAGKQ